MWIDARGTRIYKDGTYCEVPSLPAADPIVLTRSNSYESNLISRDSASKAKLGFSGCQREVSIEVDIVLVRNTLELIREVEIHPSTVFSDLSALFVSNKYESKRKFCDVTLSTVSCVEDDTVDFYAHKAVLATRSPVFETMFSLDMQESATNTIKLTDIEPAVLKELLTYIYTGECPNIKKHAESLLHHAEKYQLPHLKSLCERRLSYDLQIGNAAKILLLADIHGADQLRRNALRFIGRHIGVQETPEWEDVTKNCKLLEELVQTMHEQAGHDLLFNR